MPSCRAASSATPRPSCSATWAAADRRRRPTEPVVLRGRLPLSLRATREPHQMEPRANRGAPGRVGHPERGFPCVHVAGTNGKGSTCAFVAAELRARGLRVGLYTSPHLVSVRERVAVNGVLITEEAFADWTSTLQPHIERLDASFFEATTAIAFAELAARGVDIGVIEVGLGGRLDSTN